MSDTPTTQASDPAEEFAEEAQHAARNKKVMAKLVTRLSGDSKLDRARAAKLVHDTACIDAERLEPHVMQLVDSLSNPESQTRWEVLGALEEIARVKPMWLDPAVEPATHSLHDEDSSVVRLAAFRMLAYYGATSKRRGEKVWPLLDEALRCYHGDSEYPGMLNALAMLVEGRASETVKEEAGALVEPDASHPKAAIARGASRVFAIATDGRTPRKRKPGGMAKVGEDPKSGKKGGKKGAKSTGKSAGKKSSGKKTSASKTKKTSSGSKGAKSATKSSGKKKTRKR
jgi:hypothetical protein